MKKRFLSIYVALVINAAFGLNIDYGASIDSYTGFDSSDGSYFFGYDKLSAYSSIEFNKSMSLAVDGFYKFSYNQSESGSDQITNTFDFATLLMSMTMSYGNIELGRKTVSDYSGDILRETLDGITFSKPLSFLSIIGHAGYTGLINKDELSYFETTLDDNNIERVIEGVDLVKDMDLSTVWASVYSYQDINDLNNLGIYIGSGVNVTLGTDFFLSVRGNFQTGTFLYKDDKTTEYEGSSILAGMGVVDFTWFISSENETVKSLTPYATFTFGISSGDSDINYTDYGKTQPAGSSVSLYSPMVSGGPGVIYDINNQNLTYFKLTGSVSPLKNLQTQLGSTVFLRTVKGATSSVASGSGSFSGGNYMGTEISVTANYRPFSDLGVSFSGGGFFPDGTVETTDPYGMCSLYLSLSL